VPVLDFDDAPVSRPRKNLRLILGVGTIAAVVGVSSTLASSISLNGDIDLEFGQGIATTAACDDSIKITPVSEFSNTDSPTPARYPMKVIKVEDVDLTPEGWDFSLTPPAFNEFFTPSSNPDNPEERSWASGAEEYAGKYKKPDGSWANTCEGKVLLLRAYTNNPDYGFFAVGGSTNGPLWLNRVEGVSGSPFGMVVPGGVNGLNAGVGIRVYVVPPSVSSLVEPIWVTDIFVNDGNAANRSDYAPIITGGAYGDGTVNTWWSNAPVEIRLTHLLYDGPLIPVDSRLVDKITIESTATIPSDWDPYLDWSDALVILEPEP
jgi:hypothetical protein